MVKVLIGDIFKSHAQTLVNTINCVGIMGKGVALEFKNRFPCMFKDYQERCDKGEVKLGRPYLYKSTVPPWILNFPTKDHWRSVTKLQDIINGLEYLLKKYKELSITSLAVPPLGCGHGQLEWRIVGPTLFKYLNKFDINIELYAPYNTPHNELQPKFLKKTISEMPEAKWIKPGWIALVEILKRIEEQPYHWPIGRTIFQKIAYVATQEGIPTGLEYKKGSYGPFSSKMKNLLTSLSNNGLIQEERMGRMLAVKVGNTYEDAIKSYKENVNNWEEILNKTVDLFIRLDTKKAEIVSTVLFAYKDLLNQDKIKPSEKDIVDYIVSWKQKRRPPLNEKEIAFTVRNLASLNWINPQASSDLTLSDEECIDA